MINEVAKVTIVIETATNRLTITAEQTAAVKWGVHREREDADIFERYRQAGILVAHPRIVETLLFSCRPLGDEERYTVKEESL